MTDELGRRESEIEVFFAPSTCKPEVGKTKNPREWKTAKGRRLSFEVDQTSG